jgi:hypothetical protein
MNSRPAASLAILGFFYVAFAVGLGPFAWEVAAGVAFLVASAASARQATLIDRQTDRKVLARWSRKLECDERREAIAAIRRQTLTGLAWSVAFCAGCAGAVAVLYVWVS